MKFVYMYGFNFFNNIFIARRDVAIILYKSFVLCFLYQYLKNSTTNFFLEDI